jgi:DivIVA domain-containing protein
MLTPVEIQNRAFKSGGLGYDKKDVDSFMKEIVDSYEILYREKMELTDKVNVLNEALQNYKTIEKTMQKALIFRKIYAILYSDLPLEAQKNERHRYYEKAHTFSHRSDYRHSSDRIDLLSRRQQGKEAARPAKHRKSFGCNATARGPNARADARALAPPNRKPNRRSAFPQ